MPISSVSRGKNRVQSAVEEEGPNIAEGLQTTTNAVKRLANDSIDAVREMANELMDQGREKVREMSGNVESHVRDEPVKSGSIAAGLGFLVGVFFWRR